MPFDQLLKIHGEEVPCRAEVLDLPNLSAHADWREVIDWLGQTKEAPRMTFITHGEPESAKAFSQHLRDELGWESRIPQYKETIDIG